MDSPNGPSRMKSTFSAMSFCPPSHSNTHWITSFDSQLYEDGTGVLSSVSNGSGNTPYTLGLSSTPGCRHDVPPQHSQWRTKIHCRLHRSGCLCSLQRGLWKSWWALLSNRLQYEITDRVLTFLQGVKTKKDSRHCYDFIFQKWHRLLSYMFPN